MASEHAPDNSALKLLVQRMPMPSDGVVEFRPHFAVLIETASRADRRTEGVTCCVSKRIFHELFPGIPGEGLRA